MSKSQRLTTTFLNNINPNPSTVKSTDFEDNLSAVKDSGLPAGAKCFVGKLEGLLKTMVTLRCYDFLSRRSF